MFGLDIEEVKEISSKIIHHMNFRIAFFWLELLYQYQSAVNFTTQLHPSFAICMSAAVFRATCRRSSRGTSSSTSLSSFVNLWTWSTSPQSSTISGAKQAATRAHWCCIMHVLTPGIRKALKIYLKSKKKSYAMNLRSSKWTYGK